MQETSIASDYVDVREFFLPIEEFRGLPHRWLAVVIETSKINQAIPDNEIIETIHGTINRLQKTSDPRGLRPILLIADSDRIKLSDEFSLLQNTFCVNYQDLTNVHATVNPKRAPITNAIRRKLPNSHSIARALWPYHSGAPSVDWRFYGRSRELKAIVESTDSVLILGSRRIGKTSLLREAERRMDSRGEATYFANFQTVRDMPQLVEALLSVLEVREQIGIRRRMKEYGEKPIDLILRRLASRSEKTTLLIDEFGVALNLIPQDRWKFLGSLRGYMHSGQIRVVATAFNEFSLARQLFEAPHSNFATEIMLRGFSDRETEEFAVGPWDFWGSPLNSVRRKTFLKIVREEVGNHPMFLQEFGVAIFTEMQENSTDDIVRCAELAVRKNVGQHFAQSVRQVFNDFRLALPRYLFLKRATEARAKGEKLHQATFDDAWVKSTFSKSLGLQSNTTARYNLTQALEMRGLCAPLERKWREKRLSAPIVFTCIEETEDVKYLLAELGEEARREGHKWHMESRSTSNESK